MQQTVGENCGLALHQGCTVTAAVERPGAQGFGKRKPGQAEDLVRVGMREGRMERAIATSAGSAARTTCSIRARWCCSKAQPSARGCMSRLGTPTKTQKPRAAIPAAVPSTTHFQGKGSRRNASASFRRRIRASARSVNHGGATSEAARSLSATANRRTRDAHASHSAAWAR